MSTLTTRRIEARHLEAGDVLMGTAAYPDLYDTGTKVLGVERYKTWVLVHAEAGSIDLNDEEFVHVSGNCMVRVALFDEIRAGDEIADLNNIDGPFHCVMRVNSTSLIIHACPRGECTCDTSWVLSTTVVFRDNRPLRLRIR